MKINANKDVQTFLDELLSVNDVHFDIVDTLRAHVLEIIPEVTERIIYGGIMFTASGDFGGLFPSKKHVSFEFSCGYKFNDPENLLQGKGKYRRHLKFKSKEDIDKKIVQSFVKQALNA